MARIPDEELRRLKGEVDLAALVSAHGVELRPHGKDLVGRCPFHEDRTPSLVITPGKGLWHCMGACGTGGSVIDWVQKTEGVGFRRAVELLQGRFPAPANGTPAGRPPQGRAPDGRPREAPALSLVAGLDRGLLLRQVVDYYHETLKRTPEALEYLQGRGIGEAEALECFCLGYADRSLGLALPRGSRKDGEVIRGELQEVGVLRASGHEHLWGCVTFPVTDEEGRVQGIYGRRIGRHRVSEGTLAHLYLPGPHRGVWNIQALATSPEVILCEALIDALTFWCAGYRNVTASYGTEGFTEDHLEAFRRYRTERVLIAYDRDEAGNRAAEALSRRLLAEGMDCYRVLFPRGMDANEYAAAVRPASQGLGVALRAAEWLGKGAPRPAPGLGPEETSPAPPPPLAAEPPAAGPSAASPVEPPGLAPGLAPEGSAALEAKGTEAEAVFELGDRRYRVRGLSRNLSPEVLRVNVLVARAGRFHVDTLDLYQARARAAFLKAAAEELEVEERVLKADLGRVLLALEGLQERAMRPTAEAAPREPKLTEEEREEALSLLRDPRLADRILADFARSGVVGEETNKLVGYLAAVSRKLEDPLAVIIQSSSAAGKSSLLDALLAFVPEEDRLKYSAMTGQALYYMGGSDLAHKVLALVEEEGAQRASYALKLLQSEGELTIASTGKDPETGRWVTDVYRVEGPVALFLTTTAAEVDEELQNRAVVLTVDEDRAQTRAIHLVQRSGETLEGVMAKRDRSRRVKLHQDAQRLLRPLLVVNPYARGLTFLDDRTRTRRDHRKYLTLIRSVTLLYQHQRAVKTTSHRGERLEYIESTLDDIALANRLAHEVLGRSLDELAPQTRRLLGLLDAMVRSASAKQGVERQDYRFRRCEVRQHTGWGDTQLKVHLARLVELEYVLVHRGGRGQGFVYELLYDGQGQDGAPFLVGLLPVEGLDGHYSPGRSAPEEGWSGGGRPLVGPRSGGGRGEGVAHEPSQGADLRPEAARDTGNAPRGGSQSGEYVLAGAALGGAR